MADARYADKNYRYNYKMIQQDRIIELDREDHIKDLGPCMQINLPGYLPGVATPGADIQWTSTS